MYVFICRECVKRCHLTLNIFTNYNTIHKKYIKDTLKNSSIRCYGVNNVNKIFMGLFLRIIYQKLHIKLYILYLFKHKRKLMHRNCFTFYLQSFQSYSVHNGKHINNIE